MELKPAICPFCGADLRLPEDKKVLKCMYCGRDVIVHDAIEKAVSPTVENLLTIANSAKNSGNNKEAYDYFTKVLELNPTHYIAWFGKGESAGWLSTIADSRLPEMITGIENAVKFCPEPQRLEIKTKGAEVINNVACAYFNLNLRNMLEYGRVSNVSANFYERCYNIYKAMEIAHSYCPTNTKVIDNIIDLFKRGGF